MSSLRDHIERTLSDTDFGIATDAVPLNTDSITLPQSQ